MRDHYGLTWWDNIYDFQDHHFHRLEKTKETTGLTFQEQIARKQRTIVMEQELMAKAWHPKRVLRWVEADEGVLEMMTGD